MALLLLAAVGPVTATGRDGRGAVTPDSPATTRSEAVRFRVPLQNGRLMLRDVLRHVYAAVEIEPPAALDDLYWSIDVKTLYGLAQVQSLGRLTEGVLSAEVEEEAVEMILDRGKMEEGLASSRASAEQWLETFADVLVWWRRRAAEVTFVTDDDDRVSLRRYAAARETMPERVVVMIHGLDDPGWMFDDLAPALRQGGFEAARIEYPNDGPIDDSADLVALCLMDLRRCGVRRVDVVAHSMGGLVVRDILTREAYYAGDGAGDERLPVVDRLIMCGTPNHGSSLARLRGVSEISEQISRVLAGQALWFGGFLDGCGEAADDLLPGSGFLRRLNRRPLATSTRHTIIAARASPVTGEELSGLGETVRGAARTAGAPAWLRDWLASVDEGTRSVLRQAADGFGDGCVAVDSTRLAGVDDHVIVEATHVGMIVNFSPGGATVPPAIPIILDRLHRELPTVRGAAAEGLGEALPSDRR